MQLEAPVATPQSREDFRRRYCGFPEVVDSTMLAASACPQKFLDEYVLKLSTIGKSPDLHAGGAFAHAIQHVRNAYYGEGLPLSDALAIGTKEFIKFWGDYEAPEGSPKSFTNVINALYDYFTQYPPETDHIQPYRTADGKPAVEFTFALPMNIIHPETGNPILYGGRADMIGEYNRALLAVVDEKTTKNTPYNASAQWAMRGQFLGYCYAAQQNGFNCSTAIVRTIVLQKTQFKHIETMEQYGQWQIERWWRNTNYKVQQLVDTYKHILPQLNAYRDGADASILRPAHEYFAFNFGDLCGSYSGCPMLGLCTSEDPTVWYNDYDIRCWDPLRQDPTELSPALPTQELSWEEVMA